MFALMVEGGYNRGLLIAGKPAKHWGLQRVIHPSAIL
jgi:hypothetical protein